MPIVIGSGDLTFNMQMSDGMVKATNDLQVIVYPCPYEIDGNKITFGGASDVSVTDAATNYLYLNINGTLIINTTGWPSTSHIRLARVVCSSGMIQQVVNERSFLFAYTSASQQNLLRQRLNVVLGTDQSTTAQSWVDIPGMTSQLTITTGGIVYVTVWYAGAVSATNATAVGALRIMVNDVERGQGKLRSYNADEVSWSCGFGARVAELAAGMYTVKLQWKHGTTGTMYIKPVTGVGDQHCKMVIDEMGN